MRRRRRPVTHDVRHRVDLEIHGPVAIRDDVVFVAIKNGEHNGVGYFIDTGVTAAAPGASFPLAELPAKVCEALGVEWHAPPRDARAGAGG